VLSRSRINLGKYDLIREGTCCHIIVCCAVFEVLALQKHVIRHYECDKDFLIGINIQIPGTLV
jgi:hypothetical protein